MRIIKLFVTAFLGGLIYFMPASAGSQEIIGIAQPGTYEYSLVEGLRQFPYSDANGFYTAAVAYKLNQKCKSTLVGEDKYAGCAVLKIVTRDKLILNVEVVGMLWQMIPFLHELKPEFGQYRWWHGVVWLDKSPSGQNKYFYWHQFNMLGRFRDYSNPDGSKTYKNEVYR